MSEQIEAKLNDCRLAKENVGIVYRTALRRVRGQDNQQIIATWDGYGAYEEENRLWRLLRDSVECDVNLSLDQLRRIVAIFDEGKETK